MSGREKLPCRRRGEVVDFQHRGIRYRAAASRFEDGRLAEIFLDGGKVGADAHIAGHDAAVAISIALQFGAPADTLLHAMEKLEDGSPAGPAGMALALFAGGEGKAAA